MNAKLAIVLVGLLAMTVLAGCSGSQEEHSNDICGTQVHICPEQETTATAIAAYPGGCTSDVGYSATTGVACSGETDIVTAVTTTVTTTDWYCNPPGEHWINEIRANGYSCTIQPLAADEYGPSFFMKEGDRLLVWAVSGNGEPVPFWVCDKWDRFNDDVPSSCQLIRDAQMDLFAGLEPHQWNGYDTGHMMMFKAFKDDTHFITTTSLCDEPYGCKG